MTNEEYRNGVMQNCLECLYNSNLTFHEVGNRMGYKANQRKSVSQFIHKTTDPRLSMLVKFAEAVGMTMSEILTVEKTK